MFVQAAAVVAVPIRWHTRKIVLRDTRKQVQQDAKGGKWATRIAARDSMLCFPQENWSLSGYYCCYQRVHRGNFDTTGILGGLLLLTLR